MHRFGDLNEVHLNIQNGEAIADYKKPSDAELAVQGLHLLNVNDSCLYATHVKLPVSHQPKYITNFFFNAKTTL